MVMTLCMTAAPVQKPLVMRLVTPLFTVVQTAVGTTFGGRSARLGWQRFDQLEQPWVLDGGGSGRDFGVFLARAGALTQ